MKNFSTSISRKIAVQAADDERVLKMLKIGVWVYFFLLIFEGALRKWVIPALATPLLVIRDPVALWLLVVAYRKGVVTSNIYSTAMIVIGVIGFFTAIFIGHGSFPVALYGVRILIIHFPLMFVIGKIFDRNDVIQLGKITLMLALPMTILVAIQFYSPQSAWVNRGVGGDLAGAGYSGALGFFRPPGTFSFTTGVTLFYSFLSCFLLFFWIEFKTINKYILLIATGCLIAAIPLSISRGLLFQAGICVVFTLIAVTRKPQHLGKILMGLLGGIVLLVFLGKADFFSNATQAFSTRLDIASEQEGGVQGIVGERYLGGMAKSLSKANDTPFFGEGIGKGTNVGSMLLTNDTVFLISEDEWGRLIGEMGPLLGLLIIFIRLAFCAKVTFLSFRRLKVNDFLPWLLVSFGLVNIPQAQWSQPTALGFSTMIGGLMVAAFHNRPSRQSKVEL